MPGEPDVLTKSAYARRRGWSPSYVTKCLESGRLVKTPDGKKIDVAQSDRRYEETKDPGRQDVVDRHARERAGAQGGESERVGQSYTASRAVKERYAALTAKAEYERLIGTLCETASLAADTADAGVTLRTTLENLPHQLAPALAPITDENQVHAVLVEHIEAVLGEISRAFADVAERARGRA